MTEADRLAEAVSEYITSVPSDEEGTRPPWIRDLIMAYGEYVNRKKPTVEEVAAALAERNTPDWSGWESYVVSYPEAAEEYRKDARAAMRVMGA